MVLCHSPYRFALRFSQGATHKLVKFTQDIRNWLPGLFFFRENVTLPPDLEAGEVKIVPSIVDDADQPRARFAIRPLDDDDWHPLTSMDVLK